MHITQDKRRMHLYRAEFFDKDRKYVKYLSSRRLHHKINAEEYLNVDISSSVERRMCMPVHFVNDYRHRFISFRCSALINRSAKGRRRILDQKEISLIFSLIIVRWINTPPQRCASRARVEMMLRSIQFWNDINFIARTLEKELINIFTINII